MPSTKRPGAASASEAMHWARHAGPRVNAGMIAVRSRSSGAHAAASARGVNPSAPSASADQMSVYPRSTSSRYHSRCSCSGTPPNGTVIPHRAMALSSRATTNQAPATYRSRPQRGSGVS